MKRIVSILLLLVINLIGSYSYAQQQPEKQNKPKILTNEDIVPEIKEEKKPSKVEPKKKSGKSTSQYSIQWQKGPTKGDLKNIGEIQVPKGYLFLNSDDTKILMETKGNPATGQEVGLLGPASMNWFIVFEYLDIGYVRDDEKDSLDPNGMLEAIRRNTQESNEKRQRRGWMPVNVIGWELPPIYNPKTNNLEWAIQGDEGGGIVINYNTRYLGRNGVMVVSLVVEQEDFSSTLPVFKNLLDGYSFKSGQRYAEFRKGDKISQYGLIALVTGGATVIAAKTGLLGKLWKALVAAIVGMVGFFAKLLLRLFRRKETPVSRNLNS